MSGFNFGTPNTTPSNLPAFGAQASAPSAGFSFGLNTQTPAGSAPTNVPFGAPKPSGFNFGATASTPQQPQQQQNTFGFSNPTAVAPQPQAAGLTFGTPHTAPINAVQPISFSSAAQPTGFSIGGQQTPALSNMPSLSFGAQPATQSAMQKPATGINMVQPTQTLNTGLASGQPQAASGFSFGQQSSTAATSSAPAALSFGAPAATSAAAPLSLNPLTTSTPSTGLSFGQPAAPLFGAPQQPNLLSSLTGPSLLPTTTAAAAVLSAPQTVGLGGIDMNTAQPKAAEGRNDSTKVKEAQVPKEIIQTVEDFKAYVKQQKTLSSDIIRTTDRKLKSVTDEIKRLNCNVQEVANNVDNSKLAIKLLRSDTSQVIQHADMAQRTHETPSGLQFENVMPQIYFYELIQKYENDLLTLKHQVELTEKHLQSLSSPQNFSAQDLKRGLQQLHESFIALAGRLQEIHTKAETQKEKYLELRKYLLRDPTNVFEQETKPDNQSNVSKVQYGPNPFTSAMLGGGLNQSAQKQWPSVQQPNNTSFFGNSSFKRL